ncbi:hypothetical protein ACNQO9_15415, partial [Acinetobacter calcoaceticus]
RTENREQRTENREQRTENREQAYINTFKYWSAIELKFRTRKQKNSFYQYDKKKFFLIFGIFLKLESF